MILARQLITHLLVATVLIDMLIRTYRGAKYRDRLIRQLTRPGGRIQVYRAATVRLWTWTAAAVLVVFVSTDLSRADLGWSWPHGDGIDYLLAGSLLTIVWSGAVGLRRRMRLGHVIPGRAEAALIMPQTAHERRWAVWISFTAGITEEVLYRGLIIAAGIQLYGLPPAVAVSASCALFAAGHVYQGRRALVGVAVVGGALTAIYLISGSLLLVVALHVCQDLLALLFVPAHPSAPRTTNEAVPVPSVETADLGRGAAPAHSPPSATPARIRPPHPGAGTRSPMA